MNIPCMTAGAVGTVAFIVHVFGRGRTVAVPPAAEAGWPPAVRAQQLLFRYALAVVLFVMAATAFGKAFGSFPHEAVWAMGVIAAGISAASVIAARRAGLSAGYFPFSYLLGGMALAVAADLA